MKKFILKYSLQDRLGIRIPKWNFIAFAVYFAHHWKFFKGGFYYVLLGKTILEYNSDKVKPPSRKKKEFIFLIYLSSHPLSKRLWFNSEEFLIKYSEIIFRCQIRYRMFPLQMNNGNNTINTVYTDWLRKWKNPFHLFYLKSYIHKQTDSGINYYNECLFPGKRVKELNEIAKSDPVNRSPYFFSKGLFRM